MFSIFRTDPIKKLRSQYEKKLQQAMRSQRSGDIKTYSFLMEEADKLLKQIEDLEKQN